ncbi:MAG: hypothetical protein P4L16_03855 [Chlamydiales bacterium]|nr:hypothetical protein [Chlamydiales bacterium]
MNAITNSSSPCWIFKKEDTWVERVLFKPLLLLFQYLRRNETIEACFTQLSQRNIQWLTASQIENVTLSTFQKVDAVFLEHFTTEQVMESFTREQQAVYFAKCGISARFAHNAPRILADFKMLTPELILKLSPEQKKRIIINNIPIKTLEALDAETLKTLITPEQIKQSFKRDTEKKKLEKMDFVGYLNIEQRAVYFAKTLKTLITPEQSFKRDTEKKKLEKMDVVGYLSIERRAVYFAKCGFSEYLFWDIEKQVLSNHVLLTPELIAKLSSPHREAISKKVLLDKLTNPNFIKALCSQPKGKEILFGKKGLFLWKDLMSDDLSSYHRSKIVNAIVDAGATNDFLFGTGELDTAVVKKLVTEFYCSPISRENLFLFFHAINMTSVPIQSFVDLFNAGTSERGHIGKQDARSYWSEEQLISIIQDSERFALLANNVAFVGSVAEVPKTWEHGRKRVLEALSKEQIEELLKCPGLDAADKDFIVIENLHQRLNALVLAA